MDNDWDLLDEDEHEELEDELDEDEESEEGEGACGDRSLSEDQRRRWYDDAVDPEPLDGLLSW